MPKYAFKILLWREGFDASKDLRPWNRPSMTDGNLYFFYISTKATNGIMVNDAQVASHEPKAPWSPSRNWLRLHDGDVVVIWRQDAKAESKLELTFRCNWGGSSKPRPPPAAPAAEEAVAPPPRPPRVPDAIARKLDDICLKAQRRIAQRTEQELKMVEADQDVVERSKNIDRERQRSQDFDARRQEACKALSSRTSGRTTPSVTTQEPPSQPYGPASVALRNRAVPALRFLSAMRQG